MKTALKPGTLRKGTLTKRKIRNPEIVRAVPTAHGTSKRKTWFFMLFYLKLYMLFINAFSSSNKNPTLKITFEHTNFNNFFTKTIFEIL
jgi:hypothetical protein